jgi:undecaprenyl-diphosphatase
MGLIDPAHPDDWTAFIAVIQLGTLAAVLVYFWQDCARITIGFVKANVGKVTGRPVDEKDSANSRLGWFIIAGTLPIVIVGLLFRNQIEGALTKDLRVIAASLIGLAALLTLAEIVGKQKRDMGQVQFSDALVVGIAQCFALVPGASRSGTTITGGLFSGLKRETTARFSFLLSIPAIAASGLLQLPKAIQTVGHAWPALVAATIVAGISGYLSIAFLLRFLQRHTTYAFVAYRVALGVLLIVLLSSGKVTP